MKQALQNLLKIKSIVTILLTFVFVVLLLKGDAIPQEFTTIYIMVISFYFGTQYQKGEITDSKNK